MEMVFFDNKTSKHTLTSDTYKILMADDEKDVHSLTKLVLENFSYKNKSLEILTAYSGKEAMEFLKNNEDIVLVLLDVVMETDNAGLSLVKWIRETKQDSDIRLVLRTGQPGEAPEQDIISRYDIHDYKEKNELTAKKLFTLCYSCLRTYNDIVKAKEMQKMLRHSEKMEAVGQLASGIVHDFNNILGVILGNVELLQLKTVQSEQQARRINSINKAALMGKDIVNKLHSFTTNKLEQKENVNINILIERMDKIIDQSTSNNVQLNYQLGHNIELTYIVVSDFESALFNLIINAKDAIQSNGNISIQTSNCVLDEGFCQLNPGATTGEYVLLSISDNGKGMSSQVIQRIFEPFFTTKVSGTGLGLALVFGFVNRSSGFITLNSELDVGTTFKMYLPKVIANH